MATGDLTTLENVQGWLNISSQTVPAAQDAVLTRLISAASQYVQSWLNRTIRNVTYTETRNGQGMRVMAVANYPITAIRSLTIDGVTVPQRPALSSTVQQTGLYPGGWTFATTQVMLDGWTFSRGYQNVVLTYDAGYMVSGEARTIPAGPSYNLTTQQYWSAGDLGVTFAGGTALTKVTTAPATGQYQEASGLYTFAAADAGKAVLLSYSYVPFDLEQAVIDIVGETYKYKDRVGFTSKSIEGQSVTFMNQAMSQRALSVLNQYKRVAPI